MLKHCVQIIREKMDIRNFTFHIPLGKMTGPRQESIPQVELHLVPIKVEKLVYADSIRYGSVREYKRIAEKVRDEKVKTKNIHLRERAKPTENPEFGAELDLLEEC
jgi:O6-methylguanine-DNA--protein-cysteine methyltransferase